MEKIIIATKNQGKIKEFQEMFGPKVEVKSLLDMEVKDIEETGETFEENAVIKAEAIVNAYHLPAIADDSGLEIDALNGRPGVYSARYAGEDKNDENNITKVLEELKQVPESDRSARFVCVMAAAVPGKETKTYRGTCEGQIAFSKKGTEGFGYDPVFFVPEKNATMAELSSEEKNAISHRHHALQKLVQNWNNIYG
ncbi:XTP/dITP diphosphohydrolase [Salibacterium salarium]|uniref:XTP/dITP diphosphatase n=1 Tax=Salibacterium salarium TaxID=284579 RepID=UPI002785656A|nr:XTP/dITP diphosphatase [Salibacterium salarium]MDQ0298644.1 XTP/dITP diphosphohydrolase [Salibacterium salarium]